ncbi:hypothetical protein [Sporosarcina sp. YIM B06819]|uniref:hypothetical protein n=1 Tax=Sporosarcina sp. YIM B06819 TaxID=3081769 RepID=UPI00298C459F|nr:hypothetical protein [Sporosarcina sp. YIM B06819]
MKFGKRYSKMTVVMAMLHGVVIGVAAVVVIGLVLFIGKGKVEPSASGKEVPTAGPAAVETPVETPPTDKEQSLKLFAKQHGVFSSAEAAALFIAEDPSLAKAEVIHAGGNYFVWSAVGLKEGEIETSEYEGTFRKSFSVNIATCGAIGAGKLHEVLAATEMGQIKNLVAQQKGAKDEGEMKDFYKNITTITAFTTDLRVIRLKLLSHYSSTNNCVKFGF